MRDLIKGIKARVALSERGEERDHAAIPMTRAHLNDGIGQPRLDHFTMCPAWS